MPSGTHPNSIKNLNKKGGIPWNKGLFGEEYIKHYKNGHPRGMKGKKPWNFIDGKSNDRRFTREWRNIAKKCYERDGWKCIKCGNKGSLNAHHIIPWSISKNDSLDNLITLCISCHKKIEPVFRDELGRWIKKQ